MCNVLDSRPKLLLAATVWTLPKDLRVKIYFLFNNFLIEKFFFWIALIFYNRISYKRNEWAVVVAEEPDTAESQEAREYDELYFNSFSWGFFYPVDGVMGAVNHNPTLSQFAKEA